MNQKIGMKPLISIFTVFAVATGAIVAKKVVKPHKPKQVFITGFLGDSAIHCFVDGDKLSLIKPQMFLLQRIIEKDTVLQLATDDFLGDSTVLSAQQLTNIVVSKD